MGPKPKYILSGLLTCGVCGAHYIIANTCDYGCGGHADGACTNSLHVRRDHLEAIILNPLRQELLSPERVERIAKEMQTLYTERVRSIEARADAAPKELQDLDARLTRLRERARSGDPDLTADELQAAIERAEGKRAELLAAQPGAKASAKVLSMLPRAADAYRRQIEQRLDGDPRAVLKVRVILKELFRGKVRLVPEADGSLWAEYAFQPAALLKGVGMDGSGGRI
jgi:site-specific DNA recombinase